MVDSGPDTPLPEEDDLHAAELVLGLLDGKDQVSAVRRLLSDEAFAAAASAWERRLEPLFAALPPVDAPIGVRERILDQIRGGEVDLPIPANDPEPESRVRRWQAIAALFATVAIGLPAFLLLREPAPIEIAEAPIEEAVEPQFIAQLSGEAEDGPALAVSYAAGDAELQLRSEALSAQIAEPGRSPELWVIPADGTPRSLGLIPAESGRARVTISAELRPFLSGGNTLAVTIEDSTGAPHDAPTLPIIASGQLSQL